MSPQASPNSPCTVPRIGSSHQNPAPDWAVQADAYLVAKPQEVHMQILVNIDVPDLDKAKAFYCAAFDLTLGRKLGQHAIELLGGPLPIYLLHKPPGTHPLPGKTETRAYERHWCPIHMDIVVPNIELALAKALTAGAIQERPIETENWGKIALLADPFGHGFCLIELLGRGYDELSI